MSRYIFYHAMCVLCIDYTTRGQYSLKFVHGLM